MALHADEVVVMTAGRVVHHGASSDAATHRAVEHVFDERVAVREVQGQWVALPLETARAGE
jgi:iron complex transport system ATP-binding protein